LAEIEGGKGTQKVGKKRVSGVACFRRSDKMGGGGAASGGAGRTYFTRNFPPPRKGHETDRMHWYAVQFHQRILRQVKGFDERALKARDLL
jgi:hypothetical protein